MTSVVLAGGGTAGHTSPLIATAKALKDLEPRIDLVCIGTSKGLETRVIPAAGLELRLITPVPLPRKPGLDLLKLPFRLGKAIIESRSILKQARADALVGFGGYVSIPAYWAARSLGIPVAIHEANLLPGIANKRAASFAEFIGITFPDTPLAGAQQVGMPMDEAIVNPELNPAEARESFGLHPDLPTLLVSGGSQGARVINNAVESVAQELVTSGIQVLHILGEKNFTKAHTAFSIGDASYKPLAYIDGMARAYAAADLMVGRAGAATVTETAAAGLPVIFVPLPWGNGEQARNAQGLVDSGAAVMLPEAQLTPQRLLAEVTRIIGDHDVVLQMSEAARGLYPLDAATQMAHAVLRIARKDT